MEGNVTVTGGELIANGESKETRAISSNGGDILIKGGTIKATGGNLCYGIVCWSYDENQRSNIKITGGEIISSATTGKAYGIRIMDNGNNIREDNLIITGGKIKSESTENYSYGIKNELSYNEVSGEFNIQGGTIESSSGKHSYGIYSNSDITLGIKGDGITSQEEPYIPYIKSVYTGPENTSGDLGAGIYISEDGGLNFYDGKIEATEIAFCGYIKDLEENYKIETVSNDGLETKYLVPSNNEYVVQIDDNKYHTLKEAIDSIQDNDEKTIKVIKDFYLTTGEIEFNKNVILDLNGYTIENPGIKIVNSKNLEITDNTTNQEGKIESNGITIENNENATLTITGGNINSEVKEWRGDLKVIKNMGDLNIKGGNITCTYNGSNKYSNTRAMGIYNDSSGSIEISGGTTIKGINNSDKKHPGLGWGYGVMNYGILEISGGETIGFYAILNYSNVQITGGDIIGQKCGIQNYGGNVIMSNGTVMRSNIFDDYYANVWNAGIYNEATGTINITGGTISSDTYGNSYGIYNTDTSTLILGTKGDGIVSTEEPSITGKTTGTSKSFIGYGIYNTNANFYFYDGKIEGTTKAVYDIITEIEDGATLDYKVNETILTLSTTLTDVAQIGTITYPSIQSAIDAVGTGQTTIKLLRNVAYTKQDSVITVPSNKNIIFDLNGYKITSAILEKAIQNEGILEIIDTSTDKTGTIVTSEKTTINNISGATLTISGGTIENRTNQSIYNEGNLMIVQDGKIEFNSNASGDNYAIYNSSAGNITINGGIVNSNCSKNSRQNEYYNVNAYGIYNNSTGSINVNGGTVSGNSSIFQQNKNSSSDSYGIYNANIGSININGGIVSGYSSSTSENTGGGIDSISNSYGIYNASAGSINISGGTVSSSSSSTSTISNGSNNCTSNSNSYGIYNDSTGIINVSGGTLSSNSNSGRDSGKSSSNSYGIYNKNTGSIIIGTKDGAISKDTPSITGTYTESIDYVGYGIYTPNGSLCIYDGIIKGSTKAIYNKITEIEDNSTLVITEETIDSKNYEVVNLEVFTSNSVIANGTEYDSLEKAIKASGTSQTTIQLLQNTNITEHAIIESGQNIILDLNGYTLNNFSPLENNGTLRIIDTSQAQRGKILSYFDSAITNTGTLEFNAGEISNMAYGIKNTGTLNITGGNLNNNIYGIYNSSGTITVNGGEITSNTYGIYNSGGTTTVNNGSITSNDYGIYVSGGIVDILSTGIESNTYGVYNAGGTINIKDGAVISSNTAVYNSRGTLNLGESGTMNSNSPALIGEEYGLVNSGGATVNMYDGQIKGKTGGIQGFVTSTETGYQVATKTEGEYFVDYLALTGTVQTVAEVNGITFTNLQSAINAVTGDDPVTVKLTNGINTDETFTIAEGQNVILDLNEKTLTSSGSVTIENAGTLTIIDSTGTNVGAVYNTTGVAINNTGTLTLGEDDGTVSSEVIKVDGTTIGIVTSGTFNFYDGTISGSPAVSGEITSKPDGYVVKPTTVDGKESYKLFK